MAIVTMVTEVIGKENFMVAGQAMVVSVMEAMAVMACQAMVLSEDLVALAMVSQK